MQRIQDTTAAASLPAVPTLSGTVGFFTEGVVGVTAPTEVRGWWVNMLQEELISLLTAAGITPDTSGTNFAQVLQAIGNISGARGQCKLTYVSSALIRLMPYNGNDLTINGYSYNIPQTGVALANTGLVASTLYYVYAYLSAGVMTLEAVITTHATDATPLNYGVEIKSGDSSRTLVGMIYTGAGTPGTFVAPGSAGLNQLILNWFNRHTLPMSGASVAANTTSLTLVSVGTTSTFNFLTWADETVALYVAGVVDNTTAGDGATTSVWLDGAAAGSQGGGISVAATATLSAQGQVISLESEGKHTASPALCAVTGGTAFCNMNIQGFVRG